VALWAAIQRFTQLTIAEDRFKNDHCLAFIQDTAKRIVIAEDTSIVSESSTSKELANALLKTGLQYLDQDLNANSKQLPCLKALNVIMENYSNDIKTWLMSVILMDAHIGSIYVDDEDKKTQKDEL
jgi:hypothetical protein